MEVTTGRKYTDYSQPPQQWLISVCSIQLFLLFLQKWVLGNVLFYLVFHSTFLLCYTYS